MSDVTGLLQTAVWTATPVAFAATGEAVAERSGMLNIGLEGMMLTGAFTATLVTSSTGNPWLGLMTGGAAGAVVGILHVLLVLWGRLDQIVSGITINLVAAGGTAVLSRQIFSGTKSDNVATLHAVGIPGLDSIPVVGKMLFDQRIATYALVAIGLVVFFVLTRTTTGLRVHAAGEDPQAASLEGLHVRRTRLISNLVAGALAGIGGAFLAVGVTGIFGENMTAGRGYVALAVVILGRWNPLLVIPASGFFGFATALGIQLQTSGTHIPFQFFVALPYIATVLVLFTRIGNKAAPRHLGEAWKVET